MRQDTMCFRLLKCTRKQTDTQMQKTEKWEENTRTLHSPAVVSVWFCYVGRFSSLLGVYEFLMHHWKSPAVFLEYL